MCIRDRQRGAKFVSAVCFILPDGRHLTLSLIHILVFKELEIQGFKSFPDKVKISFDTGVTGVVGPNGSGKSNLSDAVRWAVSYTHLDVYKRQGVTFEVALEGEEDEAKDAPVQYEVTCPACGKTAVFEEDELLDGAPKCPNCGEPLDFEVTEE